MMRDILFFAAGVASGHAPAARSVLARVDDRWSAGEAVAGHVSGTIGICACGCGQHTTVPTESGGMTRRRGVPMRYVHGHHGRGENNWNWKGGRVRQGKYFKVLVPGHPRGDGNGYVLEHILIAEEVLGKSLPDRAVVHHYDWPNPRAIVICENQSYHMLIEARTKALKACGDPAWRRCRHCKTWDSLAALRKNRAGFYHPACQREHDRKRRARVA